MKQLPLDSPEFTYLEQSFGEWLDILGYAPSTVYGLPICIREFFHFLEQEGVTSIRKLSAIHYREHVEQLKFRSNQRRGGGLTPSYLNKHLQALHKLCEYLYKTGRSTLTGIELPFEATTRPDIDVLTVEEIQQLYHSSYQPYFTNKGEFLAMRDRAILSLFYGCGLRRSEGRYVDSSDINFDRGVLHVRKGKNYQERLIPFNRGIAGYLQEYLYDARPMFKGSRKEAFLISMRGGRMDGMSIALRLKFLQERSDHPGLQEKHITLHTLRHSIATHLLEAGMSVEHIARFLGHRSLESTQIYTHLCTTPKELSDGYV